MADESSVAAGKRFAKDMKEVREDRGLSVDDIHEETRVARSIIRSFENGGLYDHSTFNEVYLRSFVRTYAEALNISPDVALEGLDAALEGTYEDQLAREYLPSVGNEAAADSSSDQEDGASTPPPESGSSSTSRAPRDAPVAGGPEGRGGLVGPPRALGEDGPSIEEDESSRQSDRDDASQEESSPSSERTPSREQTDSPAEPTSEPEDEDAPAAAVDSTDAEGQETAEQDEGSSPASRDADQAIPEDSSGDDPSGTVTPTDEPTQGATTAPDEAEPTEEEEESLDVRPSWMEESPDEEDAAPSSTEPAAPGEDPPAGASPPDLGDTGIVGEATAMGEESSLKEGARSRPSVPPERGRRERSVWMRLLRGDQNELLWAGIGIAVVLVVLVGLGVAFFGGEQSAPDDQTASTAPADTAARASASDSVAADPPPPADVRLGESIPLTVIATGNVRGIRIRRDDDLRRPYWIGEGEAQVFPFEQQVTLQNELDDVRLLVAGYPYPFTPEDTTNGLELTRDEVQSFVDTLRGAPTTLSTRPDTIAVGGPDE